MRVVVVGAGAIGGTLAAHLVEHNINTILVTKYPELSNLVTTRGIRLEGIETAREVVIDAVPSIENLEGHFDIVFLATKATDAEEAAKRVLPYLKEDSAVVTLQNGIVEDDVAKIVGESRVVGAVVVWGGTSIDLGIIERTFHGSTFIGLLDDTGNYNRLNEAAELLGHCEPVNLTNNIYGALYSKLVFNACINGLTAVSGFYLGELLSDERCRKLFMGVATEVCEVAKKLSINLEKIGAAHPTDFALTGSDSPESLTRKHEGLQMFGASYSNVKSSALQSLERGRLSEIDYLNGYIAKKGKEIGIETPINSAIVRLVKEIEQGQRNITPTNLLEIPMP